MNTDCQQKLAHGLTSFVLFGLPLCPLWLKICFWFSPRLSASAVKSCFRIQILFMKLALTRRTLLLSLLFFLLQLTFSQSPAETFRITPLHPVEELRQAALKAEPPHESGRCRRPELVELIKLDPTIKLDIRDATDNNFMSTPLYSQARAFLQRPAAQALLRAHRSCWVHRYQELSPVGSPQHMETN